MPGRGQQEGTLERCVVVQELVDEDNTEWPVTLSMSSYGVAKRMFILEKIGTQL